ncbi:MAG: SMC-Scp complex subunit ScpB [Candidatus Krumholzibacteria bacterium]|nr:SMC-Scp complex subunit ScpB [Candidatus Krumholzibacteria bacterium]
MMHESNLDQTILALLFAADEPLSPRRISAVLDDVATPDIQASVERLTALMREAMPSIVLERVAGGWQLSTNIEYATSIARLYSGRRKQRLSKAGLEALAIIAYKQPITRADIENVRGVGCGGVITTLMERSLIKIVGKARVLGAPFLYGTTHEFLEYLGMNTLKDLPSMEELEVLLEQEEGVQTAPEADVSSTQNEAGVGHASIDTSVEPSSDADANQKDEGELAWDKESSTTDAPQPEDPDKVQFDG